MSDAPSPRRPHRRPARPIYVNIGPQVLIKTGTARFDFRDPYYMAISLSWSAFALLFVALEALINTIFALLYLAMPGSVANARPGVFLDAFFFSLETLATVGYGVMAPGTTYGHIVSGLEILTGMAFTAIMTGLVFFRFSKPKAKIVYADHAVITRHNGQPTLMLRIGNARLSLLTNASVTMHALVSQISEERHLQRAVVELPLLRNHLPVFAILWTLMHVIDEASPLYGVQPDTPQADELQLFMAIEARDQNMGQSVSDLHTFGGATIRFGMRYADAIRRVGDITTADFAKISALEPEQTHGANRASKHAPRS